MAGVYGVGLPRLLLRPRAPPVTPGVLEPILSEELVRLFGPARSMDVVGGLGRLALLNVMQQWGEDPPGLGELVGPHEVHLGAHKRVQDETLVSVWESRVLVLGVVGQVQLSLLHVERHARGLGHNLYVNREKNGLGTETHRKGLNAPELFW